MSLRRLLLAVAVAGIAAATPAAAQPMDPNDLAFWQSIQSAQNAAEYEAYLRQFPNGLFADLARLRISQLGTGAAPAAPAARSGGITAAPPPPPPPPPPPAPVAAPAAPAAAAGAVVGDATLTVQPQRPRVGQPITLTTQGMPETDDGGMFVVVPAGTPDESVEQTAVTPDTIASSYTTIARNYTSAQAKWTFGPLPPGAYEVRWMTQLYNLKRQYEVGARVAFQVDR